MLKLAALTWPALTKECKPWTRWWWMGSAVNPEDLSRELARYHEAGFGGVEITPIYGVKGSEAQFIEYLSPRWMEMLKHAIATAEGLGMGADMVTGTGWCFGGPNVSETDANATVVFNPTGGTDQMLSQKPSGVEVKRAAPGGAGHMLNLLYPDAMKRYLQRFHEAFANYHGPKLRAMFHDSYEYKSDWAPDFLEQFAKRRGYRLETELNSLFGEEKTDHVARVKCDYRETVSDLIGESIGEWTEWSHQHGFLSRNQAHGSPGNWLDIYAVADIPETEMFYTDRDILVSKFASSAAHVAGKNLASSESGTWVAEHFTETLADLKFVFDDLFLSGVTHLFYHGTAYSPDDAEWPGWLFYASAQMNPRNSIWHDVPALNSYAARCQSILQSGKPDNEVLLYWPIYDRWHDAEGMVLQFTVHARDWLGEQAVGKAARRLWDRGYGFDYISDRQLQNAKAHGGGIDTHGNAYRVVAVPACEHMPLQTLKTLLALAADGATILFDGQLPEDVPGVGDLEQRRSEFKNLLSPIELVGDGKVRRATVGKGGVMVGDLEAMLASAGIEREAMTDQAGVRFVRRAIDGGHHYFINNPGEKRIDEWVSLGNAAASVVVMDPMTGRTGVGKRRVGPEGQVQAFLQLDSGQSLILRALDEAITGAADWDYWEPAGDSIEMTGTWKVCFLSGGPELPAPFETEKLVSWTDIGGEQAERFAGTALYSIEFDAPQQGAERWILELGKVCQSARVRLNNRELGTIFMPPFRVGVDKLKPKGNLLEVEVTNVAANRIRDLDRRKVNWRKFYEINFVNINYKPFDASKWPVTESGLIGPVTLKGR